MLWTEKFAPQKFQDFTGNPSAVAKVKEWAFKWNSGIKQKPLLFYGSTGIGKTLLAEIVSKEMNWQLFELNASDFRNKNVIERIANAAAFNASFSGSLRLVLLDEIDGLQGTADKGGAAAIASLLKEASQPVILTCNEIYGDIGKKISSIKTQCELVKFEKPRFEQIAKFLEKICINESIDFDQKVLQELAKASNGDIRSAVLDLQTLTQASKKITLEDLKDLGFRERQQDVFKVLQKIFHAKTIQECQIARNSADVDFEMLQAWIEENIPRHFTEVNDRAKAFDYLSKADIFNARILRRQHYGFLRYSIELASSGVAIQRKHHYPGFVSYKFPEKISLLGATKEFRQGRKGIAEKMKNKMHGSLRKIMNEDLAFLQPILKDKKLVEWSALFDFDNENLAFLTGKKPDSKWVKNLLEEAEKLKKKIFVKKRRALQKASLEEVQEAERKILEKIETTEDFEKPKFTESDKNQTRLF